MSQRRPERELIDSRVFHIIVQREDHRAGTFGSAKLAVPLGAMQNDRRDIGKGLDIVDRRRFAEESDRNRKWRLLARPRFFPFDDFESRGIFAGDIVVRSGDNFYVDTKTAAQNSFTPIARILGF